jgi:hypothetical protein
LAASRLCVKSLCAKCLIKLKVNGQTRSSGRTPVQRNTFYEPIKVWDGAPTAAEAEPPVNKSNMLEDNLATA